MKRLRIVELPALQALCVGMAFGQDVVHDVKKTTVRTGHAIKRAGKKVAAATKTGTNDVGHATRVVGKDTAHGTEAVTKDTANGIKTTAVRTGDGVKEVCPSSTPSNGSKLIPGEGRWASPSAHNERLYICNESRPDAGTLTVWIRSGSYE